MDKHEERKQQSEETLVLDQLMASYQQGTVEDQGKAVNQTKEDHKDDAK